MDEFQFIARDRFGELVEETARGGGERGQILAKNIHEKLAHFLAEFPGFFQGTACLLLGYICTYINRLQSKELRETLSF